MGIYETYSERTRVNCSNDDVFQYDEIPDKLRVQVQQILRDAIGPHEQMSAYAMSAPNHNPGAWELVHSTLCREFGVHTLAKGETEGGQVLQFLGQCSAEQFVDVVEICVRMLDRVIRKWSDHQRSTHGITQNSTEAVEELNYRFRKGGVGYQFIEGEAIRVDSELLHHEVVKPALRILMAPGYEGARDEFLSSHRHYRNGDHEEAITEAAKAFESMMKAICERKGWLFSKGARASDLLKVLRTNHLWPDYLDGSFDQLLATLSSGLPQVRNDNGAHGQGAVKRETPAYVAAYALHLAGSKIVLLAEAAAHIPDATKVATEKTAV